MADRTFPSTPPISGPAWMNAVKGHIGTLYNNISLVPTAITNAGNDYTLIIDPLLDAGTDVQQGMSFYIVPNANASGPVRIRIGSTNPYYDLLYSDGTPISTDFNMGSFFHVVFYDGAFRLAGGAGGAGGGSTVYFWEFTASGVWNKPVGISNSAILGWQGISGGGGGGTSGQGQGGAGGGGMPVDWLPASMFSASEVVTIGAGGAGATDGGTTTFAGLSILGGERGANTSAAAFALGGSRLSRDPAADPVGFVGGRGGSYGNAAGAAGHPSIYGGGGGAGRTPSGTGIGGESFYAGAGGDSLAAGAFPGGGGGGNAAGAPGRVRIWLIG